MMMEESTKEKKDALPAVLFSEIDSHDYFAKTRQIHLDKLGEEKKRQREEQLRQKREQALLWRKDGSATYSKVCSRLTELKAMIILHEHFKNTIQLLEHHRVEAMSRNEPPISASCSFPIIRSVRAHSQPRRFSIQVNIIHWKPVLMKELIKYFEQRQSYSSDQYRKPNNNPLTTIRFMLRYYQQFIKVDSNQHNTLKKKRHTYRRAKDKLDKIYRTQEQCEAINNCKSIQHYHPKGCGNCGVIFIGGQLEGAVPYVKSVSRDTGVFTLVTLAFELETLAKELVVQEALVSKLSNDLHTFEEIVYAPIRIAVQNFWRFALVFKRLFKAHLRLLKSSYRYRIRRLVKMKREVDVNVRESKPLVVEDYAESYWDIMTELREYIDSQRKLKESRILQFSMRFKKRLINIVEVARERRHREWLWQNSLPPPVKPIVIKRLTANKLEEFVCYRMECRCRAFLSKERFEIHMKVHQKDDLVRYAKYARDADLKQMRGKEEKLYLTNVYDSRSFLQQTSSSASNSALERREEIPDEQRGVNNPLNLDETTEEVFRMFSIKSFPAANSNDVINRTMISIQYEPLSWTANLHHRFNLYDTFANSQTYSLQLVSKHSDLEVKPTVCIDEAMIRIGSHLSCECPIGLRGESQKEGKISKIHCILYHHNGGEEIVTAGGSTTSPRSLTIVDNNSLFGTYVVTLDGALKVPSKITQGMTLTNGALLCIGVMRDGPPRLPIVEANGACLVYRLLIS